MNSTLTALITKLNWQDENLQLTLKDCKALSQQLELDLDSIEKELLKANTKSSFNLNPEIEMTRLHFITSLLDKKEQKLIALRAQQALENQLQDKRLRLKTELTLLEKYLQRQAKAKLKLEQKRQEQALDDWVLQRRKA